MRRRSRHCRAAAFAGLLALLAPLAGRGHAGAAGSAAGGLGLPDLTLGSPRAPVTVEVFADFRCPACARLARDVLSQLAAGPVARGQVRLRYHLYATLSAESVLAARAAACAAEQGRFWAFHDALYADLAKAPGGRLPAWNAGSLRRLAEAVGVDARPFAACWRSQRPTRAVQADVELGRAWQVRQVPTLVIGTTYLSGEPTWEQVERAIRQAAGAAR